MIKVTQPISSLIAPQFKRPPTSDILPSFLASTSKHLYFPAPISCLYLGNINCYSRTSGNNFDVAIVLT
jgi:hypothetical protein